MSSTSIWNVSCIIAVTLCRAPGLGSSTRCELNLNEETEGRRSDAI